MPMSRNAGVTPPDLPEASDEASDDALEASAAVPAIREAGDASPDTPRSRESPSPLRAALTKLGDWVEDVFTFGVRCDLGACERDDLDTVRLPDAVTVGYKTYEVRNQEWGYLNLVVLATSYSHEKGDCEPLERILKAGAAADLMCPYMGLGGFKCNVAALNIAAVQDNVHAIKALVKHGRASWHPDAKLDINLKNTFGDDAHSAPLHDALFHMSVGATLCLLEAKADANIRDKKDMTPLHILGKQGKDPKVVETLVTALHKCGARFDRRIDKPDEYDPHIHLKTPLQIAVARDTRIDYPLSHLYLLAQSTWKTDPDCSLLKDVMYIAKVNAQAASVFVREVKSKRSSESSASFIKGVLEHGAEARKLLISIFHFAPQAGADVLDLLIAKPDVEDARRHPLPTYADLSDVCNRRQRVPMLCAYSHDKNAEGKPCWKYSRGAPSEWHRQWQPSQGSQRVAAIDCNYNVEVKAIMVPNLLCMELIHAIAFTEAWWDLDLYNQLGVRSVFVFLWDHGACKIFRAQVNVDMFGLVALMALRFVTRTTRALAGTDTWIDWLLCYWVAPLAWSWLLGTLIQEVLSIGCRHLAHRHLSDKRNRSEQAQLAACEGRQSDHSDGFVRCSQRSRYFSGFRFAEVPLVLLLFVLLLPAGLFLHMIEEVPEYLEWPFRLLLSLNVLARFSKYIYRQRVWGTPDNASLLSILDTFRRGRLHGILHVAIVVFMGVTAGFAVLGMKFKTNILDAVLELLLAVFKNMVGDGLDDLRNMMGEGPDAYLAGSLNIVSSMVFVFFVVNLLTAVLSNEYEEAMKRAPALFQKERCKVCADRLLRQPELEVLRRLGLHPDGKQARSFAHPLLALGSVSVALAAAPCVRLLAAASAGVCFALWQLLDSAALLAEFQRLGLGMDEQAGVAGDPHFLWICHREDYSSTFHRDHLDSPEGGGAASKAALDAMQLQLDAMRKEMRRDLHGIRQALDALVQERSPPPGRQPSIPLLQRSISNFHDYRRLSGGYAVGYD